MALCGVREEKGEARSRDDTSLSQVPLGGTCDGRETITGVS